MSMKYAIAILLLCGFNASAGITNIFIGTSQDDHTGTPLRSASIIINTNFVTVEADINNATNTAALAANGIAQTNVAQVFTGTQNFKGALQQNGVNVLTNLGTAPDAATFNAATATTATSATNLSGEGTINMTNAANQTGITFALGVFKFWASNVVVGSFTNANGGFGVSNLAATSATVLGVKVATVGGATTSGDIPIWNGGTELNTAGTALTSDFAGNMVAKSIISKTTIAATNGVVSNSRLLLAPVVISVTGSPFNFTNSSAGGAGGTNNVFVFVDGSGVTGSVGLNGTTIFSSLAGADATVPLQPGEYVTVTYSIGTPVMKWKPF